MIILKKKPKLGITGHSPKIRKCTGEIWPNKETSWEPISPSNFFTIDPGLTGTGWALWRRKDFGKLVPPIASGSLRPDREDENGAVPWTYAAQRLAISIVFGLRLQTKDTEATTFYVEQPAYMEGGKGQVTASSGSLVKLLTLYGAILGAHGGPGFSHFIPVEVMDWKGQLDKKKTKKRVLRKLPGWEPTTGTTHEIDAVGIGLYVKGFF